MIKEVKASKAELKAIKIYEYLNSTTKRIPITITSLIVERLIWSKTLFLPLFIIDSKIIEYRLLLVLVKYFGTFFLLKKRFCIPKRQHSLNSLFYFSGTAMSSSIRKNENLL